MLIAISLLSSCNSKNSIKEAKAEESLQVWVSNDTLYIDNFKYSVGIEGENTIVGDFNGLNEKVYTLLHEQAGNYKIILFSKSVDKYMSESKESLYKGLINANEVNKFSSVDYWIASKGIQDNILKNHTTVNFGEGSPSITTSEYRAANSSQTDASTTYNYDGMSDKKWIYHIPENNTFTPITKEHGNYSEVEGKWSGFINDIKDIVVKSNTLQAEVVITNSRGSSDRFTLIKRKEGHFSTNTGDPIDIGFEAFPDNSCVVTFFDHNSLIKVSNIPFKE